MTAKPKPTKANRPKKTKAIMPKRKLLEQQLEEMCKMIVFWRDSSQCIEMYLDGGRCGGGIQWGHFVPRQQSNWLKYDIGNTFCQCRNHNNLHDKGAQTMSIALSKLLGIDAISEIEETARAHSGGKKRTVGELEEMLAEYDELYQERFYCDTTLDGLVAGGYYGKIIQSRK